MKRRIPSLLLGLLLASAVYAQQATEQYIPIGRSPGIEEPFIGKITKVDYGAREMTVDGPAGPRTVRMSDSTRYYLDRTMRKRPNTLGDFEDCKLRRRVEIRFAADGSVDWIKIESL